MIRCLDCGGRKKSETGLYCKRCGYKHRERPSGLVYNIIEENPSWFVKGHKTWNKGIKGTHFSSITEFKKGIHYNKKTEFKKGGSPWNKGIEYHAIRDSKHFNWKGDEVGYNALHSWVRTRLGVSDICCKCGSTRNVVWANKSGEYKRKLSDWFKLCTRCHHRFDDIANKGWTTKRERGVLHV